MFTNLIESDSHRKEFKRRGSFFFATVVAYALVLSAAGIASIYAYDDRLDALETDTMLMSWVPPVKPPAVPDRPREPRPVRRNTQPNAPVDPNITTPERQAALASTNDPTKVPENIGVKGSDIPPVIGEVVLSKRNVDPPSLASNNETGCATCTGSKPTVQVVETPPVAPPVKPQTQRLPTKLLVSKAISLPQPPYPPLAKQIHLQGTVNVQILVDEQGKVVSAQAVSGPPLLTTVARDAALRARFTPTMLNDQPVKVQGVIVYNFVLQ